MKSKFVQFLVAILIVTTLTIATGTTIDAEEVTIALMFTESATSMKPATGIVIFELSRQKSRLEVIDRKTTKNLYPNGFWGVKSNTLAFIKKGQLIVKDGRNSGEKAVFQADASEEIFHPSLSPDGINISYIVKEIKEENKSEKYSIKVVSLMGEVYTIFQPDNIHYSISSVSWSPDNSYIAFSGQPFGELSEGSIYLIPVSCLQTLNSKPCAYKELEIADGSGERRVGRDGRPVSKEDWNWPTWSPDGKKLAFRCGIDLCTLNRDGTEFDRWVAGAIRNIQWSPDGRYIAYEMMSDDKYDIYLFDLQTGTELNITNTPDISEENPIWLTWPNAEFLLK